VAACGDAAAGRAGAVACGFAPAVLLVG